jgi:putative ABC transport system permease protein
MNVITRGIRNAFRNGIRTFSIVVILGLSIGLALTMVVARQAVEQKIASVKANIGNEVTISPAGARGFEGGGNLLTAAELAKVKTVAHVASLTESLSDRLDSTETNLQSAVAAGSIGQRAQSTEGGGSGGGFSGGFGGGGGTFTPPVMVTGTNSLSASTALGSGGGSLKLTSGKTFDPTVDADVALVGSTLATKNNLKAGSTFQAYGTTLTVDGIFDAGNTFSNNMIILPLPAEQRLSAQSGQISSAVAQIDSITNVPGAVTAIQSAVGGSSVADVTSEQDQATSALAPLQSISTISVVSVIGAMIAGAAIILLTMMMIVRERRREIGVLKAIGSSNLRIVVQFITESVTFTLLGAVVGLGLGVAGANPLTKLLVTTTTSTATGGAGGPGGFRGGGGGFARAAGGFSRLAGQGGASLRTINAVVGWDLVLYGLAAAVVIAVIGSAIPSWLIAKVRPAEVMRAE